MTGSRDEALRREALALGLDPDVELRIGGNYTPVIVHAGQAWVSGQVPRIGERIVCTGRVGQTASLENASRGARISIVRVLLQLTRTLGGLDAVAQVLRITVYVQAAPDFTAISRVGDAASDLLLAVMGPEAGRHSRTAVGVYQLPQDASVEIDLVAALLPGQAGNER